MRAGMRTSCTTTKHERTRARRLRVWIDVLFIDQLSSGIAANLLVAVQAEPAPQPVARACCLITPCVRACACM